MNEISKSEIRKRLGNITQLQELLFGEQIKAYNQKLDLHQQQLERLEGNYHELQLVMEERLAQLENQLTQQINLLTNSLEKKVQYLNLANQEEQQKTKKKLDSVFQQAEDNINYFQDSIKTQNSNFKTEIATSKIALEQEIRLLKQQITDKLDSSLSTLSTSKISRHDLAEILFELCLKLKEPNLDSQVSESQVISAPIDDTISLEENH
jgi:hypothetical protein